MFDHILQEMSVSSTVEAHHAEDDKRVKKGDRKASEKTKQARKRRRRVRKGVEDEIGHTEEQLYGAGIAD